MKRLRASKNNNFRIAFITIEKIVGGLKVFADDCHTYSLGRGLSPISVVNVSLLILGPSEEDPQSISQPV